MIQPARLPLRMVVHLCPAARADFRQRPVSSLPAPSVSAASCYNDHFSWGDIVSEAGIDENGDGRFDKLVVTVELTSSVACQYQLGGLLLAG